MKIAKSNVEKITIYGLKYHDAINVFIEDFRPGQGQMTITCYNKAWTAFWGGLAEQTMAEFFISCDQQYLAKKFDPQKPSTVNDLDELVSHARKHIGQRLVEGGITKEDARELLKSLEFENGESLIEDHNRLHDIYAWDWWDYVPKMPNPEYEYIYKIINHVKEALRSEMNRSQSVDAEATA